MLSLSAFDLLDSSNPLLATHDLVIDDLQASTTTWTLDNVPVATQTLPIKGFPQARQQFGASGFLYTNGTLLAPGALTVGAHM
ncbi:MAG TPA: hypothetical protein VGF67_24445 [Ktedonobacteraceae bacterium]